MEQAIKIAVKNGYLRGERVGYDEEAKKFYIIFPDHSHSDYIKWQEVTSSPLFWQALVPNNQWSKLSQLDIDKWQTYNTGNQAWLYYWHRFIDHLAEGKDIDSFFNELIK